MIERDRSGEPASVVGRDAEIARLGSFVREASPGEALVLIGGTGIGKTTLWEAAIELARAGGARVLSARPAGSAAQLSFGGLIDLCDEFVDADLAALPNPQRRGLAAALMRAEANEPTPPMVIALGLLGVVRALATEAPVVIAIDDLHWLDPPSIEVLTFIARRVEAARVAFLLARRPGRVGALEGVLSRTAIERIRVGPLSLGAVRRLLFERLGLTLSRHALRRIVDATEGNPLFALEVGRSLLDTGGLSLEDDVPLPDSLEQALVRRVAGLPAEVRRVLLAVALREDPRIDQLLAVIDADALDDAVDEGVVVTDGRRVRASHSLLAAAAESHARASERRELHLALSGAAADEQARAMHLAFATPGPDAALGARVGAAADEARSRGARRQAALLAAQALRLTPPDADERAARVLGLAERLDDAGELRRMTVLLREELASLPPGSSRAHAWLMLSEGEDVSSRQDQDRYLERALVEVGDDGNLRGRVLAKMAGNAAAGAVAQLDQAEAWAREALQGADEPAVQRYALWSLAWTLALGGRPVAELCARSPIAADPSGYISASPERVAATVSGVWRATYRYTNAKTAMFKQKVNWTSGTGAFRRVRATGTGIGVQRGFLGEINQALTVTGFRAISRRLQSRPAGRASSLAAGMRGTPGRCALTSGLGWAAHAAAGSTNEPSRAATTTRVLPANGHPSTVTVCSGCSGSVPSLGISPSHTFQAQPSTAAHLPGTSCTLIQNGLTFTLVNGSYVVDYGASTLCGRVGARRTVTTCVQVANRSGGRNVWFTVSGSCLSTGATSTDPGQVSTARTAHLGHGYRIMAKTTVTQGTVTRSATVFSAAAGPLSLSQTVARPSSERSVARSSSLSAANSSSPRLSWAASARSSAVRPASVSSTTCRRRSAGSRRRWT